MSYDIKIMALQLRRLADDLDAAHAQLGKFNETKPDKQQEFIIAAIEVALDCYQPQQKKLKRLREAWKACEDAT